MPIPTDAMRDDALENDCKRQSGAKGSDHAQVRVIVGPPCAGKSTFVAENRDQSHVVVDYDKIASALGSTTPHQSTGDIRAAAFSARSAVIDQALSGKYNGAWIIHSNPPQDMVEKYQSAGFAFYILDPGIDACMDRAKQDGRPDVTISAIKRWYESPFTVDGAILVDQQRKRQCGDACETVLHCAQRRGTSMETLEIRAMSKPVDIREDSEGTVNVAGYAAIFGEETNIGGMFTEVIERGAFKNAIARQDDVVFLINHDGLPLARTRSGTLKLTEDERGLYMEASLDGEDPDVRSIVPKMKRGDLDKMSFAFIPERQAWDDTGKMPKRTIQDVRLYDVSIVTTPAYEGTEIGLRSLEKHREAQKRSQAQRRLRMKAKAAGIEARNEYLPPAYDPFENVKADTSAANMQNAIENWHLGPEAASEDPTANPEFWASIAQVWGVNVAEARRRLCANCAYFNNTPEMMRQMDDIPQTAFDADGGGRGWCEKLDFICHNLRVCQAWERKPFMSEEE